MMYVSCFFTVTLFLYALSMVREERRKRVQRRIALLTAEGAEEEIADGEPESLPGGLRRLGMLLRPVWKELRRSFGRRIPGQREAKLEMKLQQAGRPLGMGAVDFRIAQLALAVALPAAAGFYAVLLGQRGGAVIGFALVGFFVAASVPHLYVSLKIKQRAKEALRDLPDVLDLLTVSLEAGLGFDSALGKLVSKKEGVLSLEFHRCLEEIRLGKTRREALLGVRERLQIEELKVLISSILQAEKLGIGMVQVLRVQSHEVREQRKQRAEEAAMKAPIKMLFPLVLFVFPSLFIVLLGPVLIQFIETFSK